MAQTLTITVDDTVYETLKPFIEQQTINTFLSNVIRNNTSSTRTQYPDIRSLRGTLHDIDTSDIREECDRVI